MVKMFARTTKSISFSYYWKETSSGLETVKTVMIKIIVLESCIIHIANVYLGIRFVRGK